MYICSSGTCVTVTVTAMRVHFERAKEVATTPGGDPIFVDKGRQPIRVDLEGWTTEDESRTLLQWASYGEEVTVSDTPDMFPSNVSTWLMNSVQNEGQPGVVGKVKTKILMEEVTSLTFVFKTQ